MLQYPAPTRWNTYANILTKIFELKDSLIQAIYDVRIKDESVEIRNILVYDAQFWNFLEMVINILKPLAKAINYIQRDAVDFSKGYRKIKEAFKEAKIAAEAFGDDFRDQLLEVVLLFQFHSYIYFKF